MNSEQIDDVIDAIASDDYEIILRYADIEIKDNRTAKEVFLEEDEDIIFQRIMNKIANGDYKYFSSIKDSSNSTRVEIFARLMRYSSKVTDIKYLIENCQKFDLSDIEVLQLIKATKDTEYIKVFIEEKERREELEVLFWIDQITDLIIATGDVDYIKSFIEQFDKRIDYDVLIDDENILKLIIGTKDSSYIKEFIKSSKKRNDVGLFICEPQAFIDLIISTEDIEFIKSFINSTKMKEIFSTEDYVDLIIATDDSDYIKSIINSEQKRKEIGLTEGLAFELIEATKDVDYIKSYIEDKNKRSMISDMFDTFRTILLIKHLGDAQYTKSFIMDKEKREKSGIEILSDNAVELIISTHDTEFIKKCIECQSLREELGLDEYYINYLRLIEATHDARFIESYIEDEQKRTELGIILTEEYLKDWIKATNDPDYLKSFIDSEEKREYFGLNFDDIIDCISGFNTQNVNSCVKYLLEKRQNYIKGRGRKIKFPTNMTIGIEIESEGKHFDLIHRLTSIIEKTWRFTEDSSLNELGVEVISPILTGDNKKTENSIRNVCNVLKTMGQVANDDCAGHIHIGADYLRNPLAWDVFKEIWCNCEEIFFIISNKEGEIPREVIAEYSEPISGRIEEELRNRTVQLNSITDVKEFAKRVQKSNRYFSVNFDNIGKSKNTIEFRLCNGTLDADTWIENINLFGGIVKTAEEISLLQSKNEITEIEKRKLLCLDRIKTEGISNEEKFEALLELIIPEEDRDIYRKRYNINSKLIEENPVVKKSISKYLARNHISITSIVEEILGEDDLDIR